jgi:4-carboxymuconolactone decarboxylase
MTGKRNWTYTVDRTQKTNGRPGDGMSEYYKSEDLDRFGEVGKHNPELFMKFIDWYNASLEPGMVSRREKVLIGVAVAHAIQCPYCIDAYTKSCLEAGLSLEHRQKISQRLAPRIRLDHSQVDLSEEAAIALAQLEGRFI